MLLEQVTQSLHRPSARQQRYKLHSKQTFLFLYQFLSEFEANDHWINRAPICILTLIYIIFQNKYQEMKNVSMHMIVYDD